MKYVKIIDKELSNYGQVEKVNLYNIKEGAVETDYGLYLKDQTQEVILDHEDKPVQINDEYVCVGDSNLDEDGEIVGYYNMNEETWLIIKGEHGVEWILELDDIYHKPLHPTKKEEKLTQNFIKPIEDSYNQLMDNIDRALKDIKEVK